ncbi:unnamed protein product [marine sediment metagenome]|uniref:Uncharacterized protein n=1 Tax=marine sediment metagenome TaxID=412755 RepID=X1UKU9_9ZZZZ
MGIGKTGHQDAHEATLKESKINKDNDTTFEKIVDEATGNVANKGWKNATQKEITLAAFGMLSRLIKNHMSDLKKPLYWAAGAIVAGNISYIITTFMGHGG